MKYKISSTEISFQLFAALIGGTDWLALLPAVMVERGLLGTQVLPIKLNEQPHRFDNCLVYIERIRR